MRLLLAAVLAGAVLVMLPGPAFACSCASRSLAELVESHDSVGVGTVAWISRSRDLTSFGVDFTEVYKGELGSREKVRTSGEEDTCAFVAVKGTRYLFFLEGRHRGTLSTGLCSGNEEYDERRVAAVERLTGHPAAPVKVDESEITERKDWFPTWVRWMIGGLVALMLLVGAVGAWAQKGDGRPD